MMQTLNFENEFEKRLHTYEPLWEEWMLTGNIIGKGTYSAAFEISRMINGNYEYAVLKVFNIPANTPNDESMPIDIAMQLRRSNRQVIHNNILSYDDDLIYGVRDESGQTTSYDLLIREEYLTPISNIEQSAFNTDEELLLQLAEDSLTALQYTHEAGIYHGGIKPENIFITASGHFKLADFGIREIMSSVIPNYREKEQNIDYAAPEEANTANLRQPTAQSDIYKIAAVMYQLLNNGQAPYPSGENIAPPRNGSKNLIKIILKALSLSSKNRYQNAGEMLADIKYLTKLHRAAAYSESESKMPSAYFDSSAYTEGETGTLGENDKLFPDGVYSGGLVNGIRSGYGKMSYNNGDMYDGSWDGDKPDGSGTFTYGDSSVYKGEFRQGKRHGKGKMMWANGDIYDGSWISDDMNGRGTYSWANGDVYEGSFVDSIKEGYGTMRYANGEVYEGNWQNNVRSGSGKLTDAKNGYKMGIWENDKLAHTEKIGHRKIKPLFIAAPAAVVVVVLITVLIAANASSEANVDTESEMPVSSQVVSESSTEEYGETVKLYSDGTYVGEIIDGKRNSHGKFIWNNGDTYEGSWSNDKMNGEGVFTWADGSKYTGTFVDNLKSGEGTMVSSEGWVYSGSWEKDMRNGTGEITYTGGSVYTGDWLDDKRDGSGKLTSSNGDYYDGGWSSDEKSGKAEGQETSGDGSVYIGEFMDGVRTGKGKLTVVNDYTYEGDFLNGTMNGTGTATFKNGDTYTGDWAQGKRVGHGTYTFNGDGSYVGDFALNADGNSVMQGQGKRTWPDGLVFEGTYVNGKRNGEGTLTREDGSREVGTWKDDKMNGFFKVYEKNGLVYEGTVKNNKGQVVCTTDSTKVIIFS